VLDRGKSEGGWDRVLRRRSFTGLYAARVTSGRGLADGGHRVGDDAARARAGAFRGRRGNRSFGVGGEEFETWW